MTWKRLSLKSVFYVFSCIVGFLLSRWSAFSVMKEPLPVRGTAFPAVRNGLSWVPEEAFLRGGGGSVKMKERHNRLSDNMLWMYVKNRVFPVRSLFRMTKRAYWARNFKNRAFMLALSRISQTVFPPCSEACSRAVGLFCRCLWRQVCRATLRNVKILNYLCGLLLFLFFHNRQ